MSEIFGDHPYPLLCAPVFKPKIWGGRRMEAFYEKNLPCGTIGESWEVADLPEGHSTIANGPLAGRSLHEVIAQWGAEHNLLGDAWPEGPFPLLVKIIDAHQDISIQVHPGEEDCLERYPNCRGKDECWVVLRAEPGARMFHGFQPGVDREAFLKSLEAGNPAGCLRDIEVAPGDTLRIAPGTVHALGKGIMILEIQQPSDTTFRIYDYDRPGDDGQPRALHIPEALSVMQFDTGSAVLTPRAKAHPWGQHEVVVDCPAYRVERLEAKGLLGWNVDSRSFQILFVLSGYATLTGGDETLSLRPGQTVILPANLDKVRLKCQKSTQLVLAGAPGVPLLSAATP